jgi:hypothetical protein
MFNQQLFGTLTTDKTYKYGWSRVSVGRSHCAYAHQSTVTLKKRVFDERLFSRRGDYSWRPTRPDLTVCHLFSWGM